MPKRINPSSSPKPLKPYYSASKNPHTQTRFTLSLTEETSSSSSQSQLHQHTKMATLLPETSKKIFTPENLRAAAKQSQRCLVVPVRLRRAIKKYLRGSYYPFTYFPNASLNCFHNMHTCMYVCTSVWLFWS